MVFNATFNNLSQSFICVLLVLILPTILSFDFLNWWNKRSTWRKPQTCHKSHNVVSSTPLLSLRTDCLCCCRLLFYISEITGTKMQTPYHTQHSKDLQSFDFKRTWWRLLQKRVVPIKFDIYDFISSGTLNFSEIIYELKEFSTNAVSRWLWTYYGSFNLR
jgi:hypothetical protein